MEGDPEGGVLVGRVADAQSPHGEGAFIIRHRMATPLQDVGLQVETPIPCVGFHMSTAFCLLLSTTFNQLNLNNLSDMPRGGRLRVSATTIHCATCEALGTLVACMGSSAPKM